MNRNRLLYLPIEIVERELDGKLLVAVEALSRGYSVMIGQFSRLPSYAERIGFGFYFYKAHTDIRAEKLFIPLSKAGLQCGALDEEGLVFPTLEYFAQTRVGEGISFRYLDAIMSWGDAQKDFLAGRFPEHATKMMSVGNPRIDLLRSPYRERFNERARAIRRRLGDFVLVNTNFGASNYAADYNMGFAENLKYCGFGETPDQERYASSFIKYYQSMFVHYIAMIKELAAAISPILVVVRPHPSENHDRWREELRATPNARVIFEGSVHDWLAAARCMIHTGCTTGIEAFFLGTPVLRYNPHYDATIEAELPNSLSDGYDRVADLIGAVGDMLGGKEGTASSAGRKERLSKWISNTEGAYSYERIMDAIDAAYRDGDTGKGKFWREVQPSAIRRFGSALKFLALRLKRALASRAGGVSRVSGVKDPSRPIGFSGRSIGRTMREFMALRGLSPLPEFRTRRITKDILLISPRDGSLKVAVSGRAGR